ncbi:hypothetical protein EJB05_14084, partial [Eragrostis curvula]
LPVGFHRFPSLSIAHAPQILEGRRFFLEPHLSGPSCPPHAAPLRRTARLRLLSAPRRAASPSIASARHQPPPPYQLPGPNVATATASSPSRRSTQSNVPQPPPPSRSPNLITLAAAHLALLFPTAAACSEDSPHPQLLVLSMSVGQAPQASPLSFQSPISDRRRFAPPIRSILALAIAVAASAELQMRSTNARLGGRARAGAATVVSCSCSSVFVGPDADADTHSLSHHAAAHAIVKRADQGAQYTQANMGIAEASLVIDSHIWLSFCLTFSMFRYLDITVLFYAIHLFPEAESADDDVLNAGQLQIKKSYYRSLLSVNNKCARLQSLSYVGGKGCEPLAQLFSEMFRSPLKMLPHPYVGFVTCLYYVREKKGQVPSKIASDATNGMRGHSNGWQEDIYET